MHSMDVEVELGSGIQGRARSKSSAWAVLGYLSVAAIMVAVAVMTIGCSTPTTTTAAPTTAAPTQAPAPVYPCDVACIKEQATIQGATALVPVTNLKYNIDVQLSAAEDSGTACGADHVFPAFKGLALNPKAQLKLTTRDTRETPTVTFECTEGKFYHLVLNDALGGAWQNSNSYFHWFKVNIACTGKGWTTTADSGTDIKQGASTIPKWFSGVGYLPPAFPYNCFHHFDFKIFETDKAFTTAELDDMNNWFPKANVLGSAWTVAQLMEKLSFADPVARTWMDVTTSYWSGVRMGRIKNIIDSSGDANFQRFFALICPCNMAGAWPGLYKPGNQTCNL